MNIWTFRSTLKSFFTVALPVYIISLGVLFFYGKEELEPIDILTIFGVSVALIILPLVIFIFNRLMKAKGPRLKKEAQEKIINFFKAEKIADGKFIFKLNGYTIYLEHTYKTKWTAVENKIAFRVIIPATLPQKTRKVISRDFDTNLINEELNVVGEHSLTYKLNGNVLKGKIINQINQIEKYIETYK